jgi:hypothetical protein
MKYKYLDIEVVRALVSEARDRGVSKIARGPGGFVSAYKRADGNPNLLSERWDRKRHGFLARSLATVKKNKEPLWVKGKPTRRHLALAMWGYTPTPKKLARYVWPWMKI